MDSVAAAIGLNPVEFRLRNLAARGQRIRPDVRALDVDMSELMGLVGQSLGQDQKPRRRLARGIA
ncbi:hypothetical protein ABTN76_20620, partial [Acinetobacter baumannii]